MMTLEAPGCFLCVVSPSHLGPCCEADMIISHMLEEIVMARGNQIVFSPETCSHRQRRALGPRSSRHPRLPSLCLHHSHAPSEPLDAGPPGKGLGDRSPSLGQTPAPAQEEVHLLRQTEHGEHGVQFLLQRETMMVKEFPQTIHVKIRRPYGLSRVRHSL